MLQQKLASLEDMEAMVVMEVMDMDIVTMARGRLRQVQKQDI